MFCWKKSITRHVLMFLHNKSSSICFKWVTLPTNSRSWICSGMTRLCILCDSCWIVKRLLISPRDLCLELSCPFSALPLSSYYRVWSFTIIWRLNVCGSLRFSFSPCWLFCLWCCSWKLLIMICSEDWLSNWAVWEWPHQDQLRYHVDSVVLWYCFFGCSQSIGYAPSMIIIQLFIQHRSMWLKTFEDGKFMRTVIRRRSLQVYFDPSLLEPF